MLLAGTAPDVLQIIARRVDFDFEFILNDESIPWSGLLVDVLSPKIRSIRDTDISFRSYTVQSQCTRELFMSILGLSNGKPLEVTPENWNLVFPVARELDIRDLMQLCLEVQRNSQTDENRLSRFIEMSDLEIPCDKECSRIASNFFMLGNDDLETLGDRVFQLLDSKSLRVGSENLLFDMLYPIMQRDSTKTCLLHYMIFQLLSRDRQEKVLDFIREDLVNRMDARIFEQCTSFMCPVEENQELLSRRYRGVHNLDYKGKAGEGIVHFLKYTKCGGANIQSCGYVIAESAQCAMHYVSSPEYVRRYQTSNLLDFADNTWYHNNNEDWVCIVYKFQKGMKIIPNGYGIRANHHCDGVTHQCDWKSWKVEIFDDEKGWEKVVDNQENNEDVHGAGKEKAFLFENTAPCNGIRIMQTGTGHNPARPNTIIFDGFEVFGTLIFSDTDA